MNDRRSLRLPFLLLTLLLGFAMVGVSEEYLGNGPTPPIQTDARTTVSTIHAHAQAVPTPKATVISGAATPTLIPDVTAYRLYFVTLASMPPARQQAQLRQARLSPDDIDRVSAAIESFKTQWQAIRDSYNQSVNERGGAVDVRKVLAQRDALVIQTRAALLSSLSVRGADMFDAHIQREKRFMKISAPKAQ